MSAGAGVLAGLERQPYDQRKTASAEASSQLMRRTGRHLAHLLAELSKRPVTLLASALFHAALLVLVVAGLVRARQEPIPFHQATRKLTRIYLSQGSRTISSLKSALVGAQTMQPAHKPTLHPRPRKTPPAQPTADQVGSKGSETGQGTGDITIALLSYFPPPHPDLSSLAQGTKGDVILDVLINESGLIDQLTLVHGIDASIDQQVMSVVKEWRFTPATKDGVSVVSEQELRFHYERT
jgi:TonB family protein